MNNFIRTNKITGVHWLRTNIENIEIKIKLKPQDGILTLPKFEDYANDSNDVNLQALENQPEEHTFQWQQKVFNTWEIQRYSDVHNCLNDTELAYHDTIKDLEDTSAKVFTYINEDLYLPLPSDFKRDKDKGNCFNLITCFEKLNLGSKIDSLFENTSSSMAHLFRSEERIATQSYHEQWTAMHVVFDNSDYNEESQLLMKQEATLLSVYHNATHNYVLLSPDVNDLLLSPYSVESSAGVPWGYQYSVEVDFGETEASDELDALLTKLYKKWEKKQRYLLNFTMPPLGKKHYCVTLEILTARDFDMNNLYVDFEFKLPEEIRCNDLLHGKTHTSKYLKKDRTHLWYFGHLVELNLEAIAGNDPPPLQLFFEVISTDWWGRHRTEGYSYLPLSLAPGRYSKQLYCNRPEELNCIDAETRRFFLGGCHLIKDLEVLAQPQLQHANYKFVSTGSLSVRWSVVSQSHTGGGSMPSVPSSCSASALLLGAEAALRKYKKARAKLAAATREIVEQDGCDQSDE